MARTKRPPHGTARRSARAESRRTGERWTFCIYVTDNTPRCRRALEHLTELCGTLLSGRYTIDIVDLLQAPARACADQIFAVPTIIRTAPEPMRKVIGDLCDTARARDGLELPVGTSTSPARPGR